MIQTYQEFTLDGTTLGVDTDTADSVHLSIYFMSDTGAEIELAPDDVENLMQQLGAWTAEREGL